MHLYSIMSVIIQSYVQNINKTTDTLNLLCSAGRVKLQHICLDLFRTVEAAAAPPSGQLWCLQLRTSGLDLLEELEEISHMEMRLKNSVSEIKF